MHPYLAPLTVALAALPLALGRSPAAPVGHPLLCQEFEIGGARTLPWDEGQNGSRKYDRTRLVADVAEILKTEHDPLVRMETLRRAALCASDDRALAWELLGRSGLAVLEQASIGSRESLAWHDLGYLAACLQQLRVDLGFRAGIAQGEEGYAYLLHALERARAEGAPTAAIEFAAALVVHPLASTQPSAEDVERYEGHLERARAGAQPGSLLERNLLSHELRFDSGKDGWRGAERRASKG